MNWEFSEFIVRFASSWYVVLLSLTECFHDMVSWSKTAQKCHFLNSQTVFVSYVDYRIYKSSLPKWYPYFVFFSLKTRVLGSEVKLKVFQQWKKSKWLKIFFNFFWKIWAMMFDTLSLMPFITTIIHFECIL